jgi:micrococcal nuclease
MTKRDIRLIQGLAVVVVSMAFLVMRNVPVQKPGVAETGPGSYYTVARVVDGDTLKLSNGDKVRLIGIDTPEMHYSDKLERDARSSRRDIARIQSLGSKASDFTSSLCLGRRVRLEFDVKKKDRYGRRLAYVYLEDGTFVNAKIIEEGYAQIMTVPPNVKYADMFLRLERQAREKNKGLWGIPDGMGR